MIIIYRNKNKQTRFLHVSLLLFVNKRFWIMNLSQTSQQQLSTQSSDYNIGQFDMSNTPGIKLTRAAEQVFSSLRDDHPTLTLLQFYTILISTLTIFVTSRQEVESSQRKDEHNDRGKEVQNSPSRLSFSVAFPPITIPNQTESRLMMPNCRNSQYETHLQRPYKEDRQPQSSGLVESKRKETSKIIRYDKLDWKEMQTSIYSKLTRPCEEILTLSRQLYVIYKREFLGLQVSQQMTSLYDPLEHIEFKMLLASLPAMRIAKQHLSLTEIPKSVGKLDIKMLKNQYLQIEVAFWQDKAIIEQIYVQRLIALLSEIKYACFKLSKQRQSGLVLTSFKDLTNLYSRVFSSYTSIVYSKANYFTVNFTKLQNIYKKHLTVKHYWAEFESRVDDKQAWEMETLHKRFSKVLQSFIELVDNHAQEILQRFDKQQAQIKQMRKLKGGFSLENFSGFDLSHLGEPEY